VHQRVVVVAVAVHDGPEVAVEVGVFYEVDVEGISLTQPFRWIYRENRLGPNWARSAGSDNECNEAADTGEHKGDHRHAEKQVES